MCFRDYIIPNIYVHHQLAGAHWWTYWCCKGYVWGSWDWVHFGKNVELIFSAYSTVHKTCSFSKPYLRKRSVLVHAQESIAERQARLRADMQKEAQEKSPAKPGRKPKPKDQQEGKGVKGKGRGKGRASHPMVALCCTLFKATGCRSLWWKLCGTAFQQGHVMTCLIWCVLKLNWTAGLEIQWVRTKSTKVFGSMLSSWRRWRHLCRALNSLQ